MVDTTFQKIKTLWEDAKNTPVLPRKMQLKNEMVGIIMPIIQSWEQQDYGLQQIITQIADEIAAHHKDHNVLYNFLRYQDNPKLKKSETYRKLSHVFRDQKIHMQAFAEGFVADFDMDLSVWGKFVLARMREQREARLNPPPNYGDQSNITILDPKPE